MFYRTQENLRLKQIHRKLDQRDINATSRHAPKMLACQRSLTKYRRADIIEEFDLARTVLTMLKLRDDPQGRAMAAYLQWLLLKTETRDRRQSPFRF